MTKQEWYKRVQDFIDEIASDEDLVDEDYLAVLEEVESLAETSIAAKKEELNET